MGLGVGFRYQRFELVVVGYVLQIHRSARVGEVIEFKVNIA